MADSLFGNVILRRKTKNLKFVIFRYIKAEKIAFIIEEDNNLRINQICEAYDYIEQEE